jgi:nucleoid-associated protein YgaU
LTIEHLFATIVEHMFATLDIRRIISLAAAAACALALAMSYAAPSSSGASSAHPRRHDVRAGETLWAIAERAYPTSDPRDAVYRIEQANGLHDAGIAAGQVLVLP